MHFSHRHVRLCTLAALGLLPVVLGVGLWVLQQWHELRDPLARVPELSAPSLAWATEIYDHKGEKIGEFSEERRYFVRVADLPKPVIQAFLSAEDKSFFQHAGVSPLSIVRAALANLRGGGFRQGASTLTQQLARMSFLTQEKSLARKFKEAVLALAIERHFSKDQILELYLNTIYLGARSYGIEAAARNYFRKNAAQLTVSEAALLAALPKSPAAYSPQKHPQRARARRAWVLGRMAEDGSLSKDEAKRWAQSPLRVAAVPEDHWSKAPYFVTAVRQDLHRKFELSALPRYGLRIHTTLDATLQRDAAKNLQQQLHMLQRRVPRERLTRDRLEGAVVILDPQTGAVRAMQGGRGFRQSQFNRTADTRRALGSLVTPLLAALALERGYSPLSLVAADQDDRSRTGAPRRVSPTLLETLADATGSGSRTLSILLGYGSVGDFLRRLGILSTSVAGQNGVHGIQATPLQVGAAYAVTVNGGHEASPYLITRVEDREGHVLFESSRSRVVQAALVDPKVAFVTYELLKKMSDPTLPLSVRQLLPAATSLFGRSDDERDVWLVGLLPSAVSVLWLGSERGQIPLGLTAADAQGMSAAFWSQAAQNLHGIDPRAVRSVLPPAGVAYVRLGSTDGRGHSIPMVAGTEALLPVTKL